MSDTRTALVLILFVVGMLVGMGIAVVTVVDSVTRTYITHVEELRVSPEILNE